MQEYIVTLIDFNDSDGFYEDMETEGGLITIPDRVVELVNRRPISRNTHYMLTEEEADQVRNDPRVLDVELKPADGMVTNVPTWTQTSTHFDKSTTDDSNDINWALLRCTRGSDISGWGSNGTVAQTATVSTTSSGKDVDVVIVDGHIDPAHPEFAVNDDGTGGTRVFQYNWYQHTPAVTGGVSGTYPYPTSSDWFCGNDNHGMHCAGTVAGNRQGWARDANIYNITPYSYSSVNSIHGTYTNYTVYNNASNNTFDYIREFHNNKSVNPSTGRKNPTVTNNSWGSSITINRSEFISVNYRGVTVTPATPGSPTDAELDSWGLVDYTSSTITFQFYSSSSVADVIDAINDGVIVVSAAGNDSTKIAAPGDVDYDNRIRFTYGSSTEYLNYYHRGSWNGVAGNGICVGSVDKTTGDYKATYSNSGTRVDIYAPGTAIQSSVHDGTVESGGSVVTLSTSNDPRDNTKKLNKYQGTSMASPQVCGVLACALEHNPNMTQQECVDYLQYHSTDGQITTSGSDTDYTNLRALHMGDNFYLYYNKERKEDGAVSPILSNKARPDSGAVFPRARNRVYA